MSDQAPLPGTDDKQVIADIDAVIDSMHDRYRELWVEMALEDIDVPDSLQSSFNRTYQQIDSLTSTDCPAQQDGSTTGDDPVEEEDGTKKF